MSWLVNSDFKLCTLCGGETTLPASAKGIVVHTDCSLREMPPPRQSWWKRWLQRG